MQHITKPGITKGGSHADVRGALFFNNDFDASAIKRFYLIENADTTVIRGWQGHKIEQRWFSAIKGAFKIQLAEVAAIESGVNDFDRFTFEINASSLDILHVPARYVSCIQALEEQSKLLVMADYLSGEVNDEYRFAYND